MAKDKSTDKSSWGYEGGAPGTEPIESLTPAPAERGQAVSEQEFNRTANETGRLLAKQPKRQVRLFQSPKGTPQLPDATVCVNGYIYLIKRGVELQVPETVYHILDEAGLI